MPGFYSDDEYDLAGFAVGIVDKCKLLPTQNILEGDEIIYLPSSGIHSNGFSLIRKIMEDCNLSYEEIAPFSPDNKTYGRLYILHIIYTVSYTHLTLPTIYSV